MDLAELRKQVKQSWVMLGGALLTCLLLFSVYLMPTTSAWHIANSIVLAIQVAFVIYNVTGLVKLKAYVRERTSR
jgi:Na+-translocating ferredoxin:NAD+ oxidoreductase RnfD subunit